MCKFSKPNYILIITLLLIGVCQIHAARSIRSNASDREKTQEEKLQKSSGTIDRNERLQATNSDQENSILWERLLRDNDSFPSPPTRPPSSPTTPPAPTPFPPTVPPSPGPPTFPPTFRPTDSPRPPSDGILCGIPVELRSQLLTNMAEQISGTILQGTPQSRALNWLINQDTYIVCPDDPKAYQRYILALFYFSTDGDNWEECSAPLRFDDPASIDEANDNCSVTTTPIPGGDRNPAFLPTTEGTDAWLTPVYECEWAGITCRVEGECVDRIEFEGNGVGGNLPYELRDLGDLRFLILERGTMTGTIPSEFSEIEDLLFLDLDFNQLTGTIPESIFGLTGMIQLDLNNNELTGTLSPSIGNLRSLVFFQLAANQFSGTIPRELDQLQNLLTGSFEFNENLSGEIPEGLCNILQNRPTYTLIADCNPEGPGRPPRVACGCCTDCYP